MLKQVVAIVTIFVMLAGIAIADDNNKKLTIIRETQGPTINAVKGPGENSTGVKGNVSIPGTQTPIISLWDAALRSNNTSGNLTSNTVSQSSLINEIGEEKVEDEDFLSGGVSKGLKLFVREIINGLYTDIDNSTVINETEETSGNHDLVFNIVTYSPNPYESKKIVELYGGYLNMVIFFITLFVLGELISRTIARAKMDSGFLRHKNLSQHKFIGGVVLCGFAVVANLIYMGALYFIEALNGFIILPDVPLLAPSPDNLLLFSLTGLCNLVILGFFGIRILIISIFAVVCSIIAVLLVPEITRDFATNLIEKIARILLLQPIILLIIVIGRIGLQDAPGFVLSYGNFAMSFLILLTCWYILFGNYKILKVAVVFAVRKGLTKI